MSQDVADVCRELQVSEQTYYRWRNQFGGLKPDDAKRLKGLFGRFELRSPTEQESEHRR